MDDRNTLVHRLLRQAEAFETLTITCSRCTGDAALSTLYPTARGFICQRCMTEMPTSEYRDVCGEIAALAAVHRQLNVED